MDFKEMTENHKRFWTIISYLDIIKQRVSFFTLKIAIFEIMFPGYFYEYDSHCFLCIYDSERSCPGTKSGKCTDYRTDDDLGCLDGLYNNVKDCYYNGDVDGYRTACLKIANLQLKEKE